MSGVDETVYAIRVTCLGDSTVLRGEPVMIYYHKDKLWNATFLAMTDNNLPELYKNKDEAILQAQVLQYELDILSTQMRTTMKLQDAEFFVRVVRWDITDFYLQRDQHRELSSVGKRRKRKREKDAYLKTLYPDMPTKRMFRKAVKPDLGADYVDADRKP